MASYSVLWVMLLRVLIACIWVYHIVTGTRSMLKRLVFNSSVFWGAQVRNFMIIFINSVSLLLSLTYLLVAIIPLVIMMIIKII